MHLGSGGDEEAIYHARLDKIESRLLKLEARYPPIDESAGSDGASPSAAACAYGQSREGNGATDTRQRLTAELLEKGVPHSFKQVGPGYYDLSLEDRRSLLGATSIQQLCKSMVMENTKAPAAAQRYFLVVIQYASAIHAELLKRHVLSIETSEGKRLSRSQCNMRLASPEDSNRLTGYIHNAVSPVGLRQPIPLIMASEIAELQFMWLGGGEPDLKLGLSVPEFIAAYNAVIVDCSNQRRAVDKNM